FGVQDANKKIIGTQFRSDPARLMNLKEEIAKHTTSHLTFSQIYIEHIDGKRVLLFQIPAAPQGIPIEWKRHYYGRDNEALGGLNIAEIERIRGQAAINDWSAGLCPEANLDDLEPAALAKAREMYQVKNPHLAEALAGWDDATFLNKVKFSINGQLTRTALILLGTPESSHYLSPAIAQITWILKDKDGIEKDYEHFHSPLLLSVNTAYQKIRKLRYRYLLSGELFPEEVDQYDPYLIRECLNNAVAHQDYERGGRILIVENENDSLIFANEGTFLPGTVENVIRADAPSTRYRNAFLVAAMVNLNLIDTIGSGIKKMFSLQRDRFFPMPEYDTSDKRIKVTIIGKVIDINYATKLATMPDMSLQEIMTLDKVQKGKELSEEETKLLKGKGLVEGRRPNLHISSNVAAQTDQEVEYMKQRGIDKSYCQKIMLDALEQFGEMKRAQFENILMAKLPDALTNEQKQTRIKNYLQELRRSGEIEPHGHSWRLRPGTS
ncbi:MAG: ATP-dependent DNA helicase RecG, partial [Lentimonas sp.]